MSRLMKMWRVCQMSPNSWRRCTSVQYVMCRLNRRNVWQTTFYSTRKHCIVVLYVTSASAVGTRLRSTCWVSMATGSTISVLIAVKLLNLTLASMTTTRRTMAQVPTSVMSVANPSLVTAGFSSTNAATRTSGHLCVIDVVADISTKNHTGTTCVFISSL